MVEKRKREIRKKVETMGGKRREPSFWTRMSSKFKPTQERLLLRTLRWRTKLNGLWSSDFTLVSLRTNKTHCSTLFSKISRFSKKLWDFRSSKYLLLSSCQETKTSRELLSKLVSHFMMKRMLSHSDRLSTLRSILKSEKTSLWFLKKYRKLIQKILLVFEKCLILF